MIFEIVKFNKCLKKDYEKNIIVLCCTIGLV